MDRSGIMDLTKQQKYQLFNAGVRGECGAQLSDCFVGGDVFGWSSAFVLSGSGLVLAEMGGAGVG